MKCCFVYFIAFENFTIGYVGHQQPDTQDGNASIILEVTFSHEVSIVGIMISIGEGGQGETCTNTSQPKSMTLTCTDLDDDTLYNTSFGGVVKLASETYPLQFNIVFSTEPKNVALSG